MLPVRLLTSTRKMDHIVIDIETKNTFFDVGRDNFQALDTSMVCIYSYSQDKYFSFDEHQLQELGEFFKDDNLIIGFSINRFDIPVLNKHYPFDLFSLPRYDLLDEIELQLGRRISLNKLAKTNLGVQKTGHGLDAPILYREGKIDELRDYCLNDVKITKELYDLAKKQGYLWVPKRDSDEMEKAIFDVAQTLF